MPNMKKIKQLFKSKRSSRIVDPTSAPGLQQQSPQSPQALQNPNMQFNSQAFQPQQQPQQHQQLQQLSQPPPQQISQRPQSQQPQQQQTSTPIAAHVPSETVPNSFILRVSPEMWPLIDCGDDPSETMKAAGPLLLDYTEGVTTQWARGANVGNVFCKPLFTKDMNLLMQPSAMPPYLFDLLSGKLVKSETIGRVPFAVISHVWGPTVEVDGAPYGVEWKICIKSEARLRKILEAARVVVGEQFVWMDVLCMDPRMPKEETVAQMKMYLTYATGCFVWLDNTYDEPGWEDVLTAIREVNSFYNMDQSNAPLPGTKDRLFTGGDAFNLSMNENEALGWVQRLKKLEIAPWFRRVWPLQEGVIPDRVFFCTSERYMTSGANIWTLCTLISLVIKQLKGSMMGTAVAHEMHRSEIYKMLVLRQLYRRREISFWHLAQAVKSRQCSIPQDKVFGILGLMPRLALNVDYSKSLDALYLELFASFVRNGDFDTLLYLAHPSHSSLYPDMQNARPYIRLAQSRLPEKHTLTLQSSTTMIIDNLAADVVTKAHCIIAWGDKLIKWQKNYPHFMDMSEKDHFDVARAFGLDDTADGALCPASFAALLALGGKLDEISTAFGSRFYELAKKSEPTAMMQWLELTFLQDRQDVALVMLWSTRSPVQLALVTEPLEIDGGVISIMPYSYYEQPGEGCAICKYLPNGKIKKVGVGLGKKLLGDRLISNIELIA